MHRGELSFSDSELKQHISAGYGIAVTDLQFIDSGMFFGFIGTTTDQRKFFIKIYPVPNSYISSIKQQGEILDRLHEEFGLTKISRCRRTRGSEYSYSFGAWLCIVYDYIEGFNPSYEPNQLAHAQLARLFSQLHSVPISEFAELPTEQYDLSYALGLQNWLLSPIKTKNSVVDAMLEHLQDHKKGLQTCIQQLLLQQPSLQQTIRKMVITHGDPHHYNVLQTDLNVWLVDWDDIKVAPPERDLWHYLHQPAFDCYQQLNPALDLALCKFYQCQRFIEDIRYYVDDVALGKNLTVEQNNNDQRDFFGHWGWKLCI